MQGILFRRREFLRCLHRMLIGSGVLIVSACADDPATSAPAPAQHARVDVVRMPVTDAELSSQPSTAGASRRVW